MAKMPPNKKWLIMTAFLIIMMVPPILSYDKQASINGNDGSQLINILTNMQRTIEGRSQGIGRLSSKIQETNTHSQPLKVKERNIGQSYYTPQDSESCGIQCLECKNGECTRYNWIGAICLVLLIGNVLALAYWILLIRKKGRQSTTKDSLLTEIGSISRSVAFD